jgi:hypothetical protein
VFHIGPKITSLNNLLHRMHNKLKSFVPDVVMISDYFPEDSGNRSRRMFERARFLIERDKKILVIVPRRDENREQSSFTANYISSNMDNLKILRVEQIFYKKFPTLRYQDYSNNRGYFFYNFLSPFFGYIRWVFPVLYLLFRERRKFKNSVVFTPNNPIMLHAIGFLVSFIAKGWVAELRDPIVNYISSKRGKLSFLDTLFESMVFRRADKVLFRKGIEVSYDELVGRHPYAEEKLIETPDYGVDLIDFKGFDSPSSDGKHLKGIYAGNYYIGDTPINLIAATEVCNFDKTQVLSIDFYGSWNDAWPDNEFCKHNGSISYWNLLDKYKGIDFVIIFVPSTNETKDLWVPSKMSELIAAKKPIFLIGDIDSYPSEIVRKNKIGIVCKNDQKSIEFGLSCIKDMVLSKTVNIKYFESIKDDISNYSAEHLVNTAIDEVLHV